MTKLPFQSSQPEIENNKGIYLGETFENWNAESYMSLVHDPEFLEWKPKATIQSQQTSNNIRADYAAILYHNETARKIIDTAFIAKFYLAKDGFVKSHQFAREVGKHIANEVLR